MSIRKEQDLPVPKFSIGIVGAGISGITLAIRLHEIGFYNFTIYERDVDVGGTWLTNTYPGCRCDIAAHLYSLSSHLNPDWTESHPPQSEILAYWQQIARSENIYPHIQFLTSFISAQYDPDSTSWIFKLKPTPSTSSFHAYAPEDHDTPKSGEDGGVFEKRHTILISGTGGFSWPLIPTIKGLPNPYLSDDQPKSLFNVHEQSEVPVRSSESSSISKDTGTLAISNADLEEDQFQGKIIHPARWPRSGLDLQGQRVAVLGNGCSATQIVSALGADPKITILNFIRSGQWFLPSGNSRHSSTFRFLLRNVPGLIQLYRFLLFIKQDAFWFAFELQNVWIRKMVEKDSKKHIKKSVLGETAEVLTPTFPFGAKRTVMDRGYLKTLNLPNVEAISQPISKFTKNGIVTSDGKEHPVDVAVIATGYDVTASMLDVTGKNSVHLSDSLLKEDGPGAYRGMLYPGFPNMYVMLGHNVATGHTSVMVNIEVQAKYIAQVVQAQLREGVAVIEAKEEPTKRYMEWLDKRIANTTWTLSSSFYRLGKDRKGRVFTNWPAFTALYCIMNRKPKWSDLAGGEKMAIKDKLAKQKRIRLLFVALLCLLAYRIMPMLR